MVIKTGKIVTNKTNLRGLQTDKSCILGTKAIYDFEKLNVDNLLAGDTVENIFYQGEPASCTQDYTGNFLQNKGLVNAQDNGAGETLQLPAVFDLNTLGSTPEIILSIWVTHKTPIYTTQTLQAIAGFAYYASNVQWKIETGNNYQQIFTIGGAGVVLGDVVTDIPQLLTACITKVSDTETSVKFYLGKNLLYTKTGSYPLKSPDHNEYPKIGAHFGYRKYWNGVVHRISLHEIDTNFDQQAWVDLEYDNNFNRFVV